MSDEMMEAPDPRYMAMTPEQRLEKALSIIDCSLASTVELARVLYAMKCKGDDMTVVGRRFGDMLYPLLKIGGGQVLADLYKAFGLNWKLYSRAAQLDREEQRRLAAGEPIPVLVYTPDGQQTHRMKAAADLDEDELPLVFAKDHIRTLAEQASFMDRKHREAARPKTEVVGRIRVDRVARVYRIGNHVITEAEYEAARKVMMSGGR